jgi:hypothetical protein
MVYCSRGKDSSEYHGRGALVTPGNTEMIVLARKQSGVTVVVKPLMEP